MCARACARACVCVRAYKRMRVRVCVLHDFGSKERHRPTTTQTSIVFSHSAFIFTKCADQREQNYWPRLHTWQGHGSHPLGRLVKNLTVSTIIILHSKLSSQLIFKNFYLLLCCAAVLLLPLPVCVRERMCVCVCVGVRVCVYACVSVCVCVYMYTYI